MPVIRDIPINLELKEILRHEGIRQPSKLKVEVATLLRELLAHVADEHLLKAAIVYKIYSIAAIDRSGLRLKDNTSLNGSLFSSVIPAAEELAVAVCTIGPTLEKKVADYFHSNEPLKGVLLDGIGSAAVDSVTQEVCKLITQKASSLGYQASSPLNPGMAGFPISEQWQLFQLVPAEEIGVSLTPSGVMVPRKSISMVIGIGAEMTTWTQAKVCARCNLKKTCLYRISV